MLRTNDDPRALRSRAAALAAATELLVEGGPENVTHATVAKRAGIGRATVYPALARPAGPPPRRTRGRHPPPALLRRQPRS